MASIYALVELVRLQIFDTGNPQVFADIAAPGTSKIVPNSSPELIHFVHASLADFSRYRELKKPFTLNIVATQTTYPLPDDWMGRDPESFDRALRGCDRDRNDWNDWDGDDWFPFPPYELPGVQIGGPLLLQNHLRYNWYDALRQVVLSAAPTSAYSLTFDYYAMHTPETLPRGWEYAAILPACEKAIRAIQADQAVKLQRYKIKNEIQVDNYKIPEHLEVLAKGFAAAFRREVVCRPFGTAG